MCPLEGANILWVEDTRRLIESHVELLMRELSPKMDFAATVGTALHKLLRNRYDLVIFDGMLPACSSSLVATMVSPEAAEQFDEACTRYEGVGLLRVLRSGELSKAGSPNGPDTPAIIYTSRSPESVHKKVGDAEAAVVSRLDDDPYDFVGMVKSLLSESQ